MKNSADLGGCYLPRPSASVDNTLLELQNSSYPTLRHSLVAKDDSQLRNLLHIAVSRTVVLQTEKSLRNNVESCYG